MKKNKTQGAQKGNRNASKPAAQKAGSQLSLRFKDDMHGWVETQAARQGISKTKVIIQAVAEKMQGTAADKAELQKAGLIKWVRQEKLRDANNDELPHQYKEACHDVWTDVLSKLQGLE